MPVLARLDWITRQLAAGRRGYVAIGTAKFGQLKVKVLLQPEAAVASGVDTQRGLGELLAVIRQLVAQHVTTDRGHMHTNGITEVAFWVNLRKEQADHTSRTEPTEQTGATEATMQENEDEEAVKPGDQEDDSQAAVEDEEATEEADEETEEACKEEEQKEEKHEHAEEAEQVAETEEAGEPEDASETESGEGEDSGGEACEAYCARIQHDAEAVIRECVACGLDSEDSIDSYRRTAGKVAVVVKNDSNDNTIKVWVKGEGKYWMAAAALEEPMARVETRPGQKLSEHQKRPLVVKFGFGVMHSSIT